MVDYIDSLGWVRRTKIQWIFPKDREVSHNKIYNTLAHFISPKNKEGKLYHIKSFLTMIFDEMQENISKTWSIPPEVVRENQGITYFKVSRHNMWIHAKRDPMKEWLQLRYCVTGEEVQWAMKYWPKEWKVTMIPKKVPISKKKVEVGTSKKSTSPAGEYKESHKAHQRNGGSSTIKKPRQKDTIPKAPAKEKEHASRTKWRSAERYKYFYARGNRRGNLPDLEIPVSTAQTETLPLKRTVLQTEDNTRR
jgi:hypothetical protein